MLIEKLKEQMRRLEVLKVEMLATPDQQILLTDPDVRSMATSDRGSHEIPRSILPSGPQGAVSAVSGVLTGRRLGFAVRN
jgi:hypothetical protein